MAYSYEKRTAKQLLKYELIKQVVEYVICRIHTKEINFHITTNASLLSDDIVRFFVKYKFKVSISLDGDSERQNWARKFANGKPTFDIVWKNAEHLLSNYKYSAENIKFLPVVFVDEDKNRVLDFFSTHDISPDQIIFLDANTSGIDYSHGVVQTRTSRDGVISTRFVDYDEVSEKEYEAFLREYRNKHAVGETWHHSGACIPGAFKLFVDTKGNFFPCENSPQCEDMCIGNLTNGINVSKEIRLYNLKDYFINIYVEKRLEANKYGEKSAVYMRNSSIVGSIISFVQTILLYIYFIYKVVGDSLSVGTMTIYMGLIMQFSGSLSNIARQYLNLSMLSLRVQELIKFMNIRMHLSMFAAAMWI